MTDAKRWVFPLVLIVMAIGLFTPIPTYAADVRTDANVVVAANEVIADDLYAFGDKVMIHGTIQGDLIAFGSYVLIDGHIEGDVLGAAEVLEINGTVTDDIRVAAQTALLGEDAAIGDDAFIAAYTLQSLAGSSVGGNLGFATAQTALAGDVVHSVWGSSMAVRLAGDVGGDVTLELGDLQEATVLPFWPSTSGATLPPLPTTPVGLTVAEGAQVNGQLYYTSTLEATLGTTLANMPIRTEPPVTSIAAPITQTTTVLSVALDYLRRVVTLLLVGVLVLGLRSVWVQQSAETIRTRYLHSAGWGIVAYIAFFVVAAILLIGVIALTSIAGGLTLGGLAATLLGIGTLTEAGYILAFLLVVNYIAQVVVSVMVGHWLLKRLYPAWAERPFVQLIVGVLLLAVLEAIPYVGMVVGWFVVLPVLGVLWETGRTFLRPTGTPVATTTTLPSREAVAFAGVA